MPLKQWPSDGSIVSFDDILQPLRKALRRGEYTGFDIGERDKACCLSPDEALSPEALEGKDRAAVILTIAIQLGIEQGRRLKMQEVEREFGHAIKDRERGASPTFEELLAAIRGS